MSDGRDAGFRGWRLAGAVALWPSAALAHVGQRGLVLLLPTGHYIWGGAAVVAATFLALAFVPGRWLSAAFAARLVLPGGGARVALGTSWAGFAVMAVLIAAGLEGSRDPLVNPLPLAVWTVFWIAFLILHAVLGDIFGWVNPWSGPLALARRLGMRDAPLTLPAWFGLWPATAGLLMIYWFALIDVAPDDPARLARAVVLWWAAHFAAMLVFGEAAWRSRGETLSVLASFLARLAPVGQDGAGRRLLTLPGARAVAGEAPRGTAAFLLLALAGGSFDGLNETFWWLGLIGINPLEFPGRSAVMVENSVGLVAMWALLNTVYWGCVALGARLAGGGLARAGGGALALSLLPIALAYHLAHYLIVLLINGQYTLVALSDPFATGADLLGLGRHFVTTSFLAQIDTVSLIWDAQAATIVVGHVWAVVLAHAIAVRHWGPGRAAALSQAPLAGLMVLYTLFGLWLLATPTGA